MDRKVLVIGIICLLFGTTLVPVVTTYNTHTDSMPKTNHFIQISGDDSTLYVGGTGPNNYTRIQDAINNASRGDKIVVYYGTYNESIVLDKQLSLIGVEENGRKPLIEGGGRNFVVCVTANGCCFRGFKVLNYGNFSTGIIMFSNFNLIDNNSIQCYDVGGERYLVGISASYSSYNIISGNVVSGATRVGIWLYLSSHDNLISQNSISQNNIGIKVESFCDNTTIIRNEILENKWGGVLGGGYNGSKNLTIAHNNIWENGDDGIYLHECENASIFNNSVHSHYYYDFGIFLYNCRNTSVYRNEIYSNDGGLYMGYYIGRGYNNVIKRNHIHSNTAGVTVEVYAGEFFGENGGFKNTYSENSIVENNLISNERHAYFRGFFYPDEKNPLYVCPLYVYTNLWRSNYWSNWKVSSPKPIVGSLNFLFENGAQINIPWLMLDKHPVTEPYER